MDRQLGIGVIGLGWMGRVHSPRTGGCSSTSRISGDPTARRRLRPQRVAPGHAERIGFERTVADWHAVLEDPAVDLVSVTVPNAMHREIAVAVAEAGKHMWVEKPVGRGAEDTEAVTDAVRRAGVINGVGFCYRFAPAVAHAAQLIEAGELGDVTHYRGTFLADYANRPDSAASWRFFRADAGSGALGDLMAHVVDLTHFLVGPIERLSGPDGDADRAPAAAADGRGHALHARRDRRARRGRERRLGGRAGRVRLGHRRVDRGVARRRRAARRPRLRGPRHRGSLCWELERMNELQRYTLRDDGGDEGYSTVFAGPQHPASPTSSPAQACRWATTTCASSRPRTCSPRSATASNAHPAWPRWWLRRTCSRPSNARPRHGAWEPARAEAVR